MQYRKLLSGLFLVGTAFVLGVSTALAESTDPFMGASPAFDTQPQPAKDDNVGDWGVSEQRGAATYTFPINVPPGRNGMAPSLALRYSSRSPLRGGLAVGWSFDLPSISLDRSLGVGSPKTFQASIGSASGRLAPVPDQSPYPGATAYRAQYDDSFTRFFQLPDVNPQLSSWVALTTNGVKHYFGTAAFSGDGMTRWLLSREEDPFGNTVQYRWSQVVSGSYVDYALQQVLYTSNSGANLPAQAKVEFGYAPLDLCQNSNMPIGAAPLRGQPNSIEGASKLTSITTHVYDAPSGVWRIVRSIALTYELRNSKLYYLEQNRLDCHQVPLRYLTRIETTAYSPQGAPTALPPVTFSYNSRLGSGLDLLNPTPMVKQTVSTPGYGHHGDPKGAINSLVDIDSDGIKDRVRAQEQNGKCVLVWRKGLLGGAFAASTSTFELPTAAWMNGTSQPNLSTPTEYCRLNGQRAYRQLIESGSQKWYEGNLSYSFMDYTGDGRLDLVTSVWAVISHSTYVPPYFSTGLAFDQVQLDQGQLDEIAPVQPILDAPPDDPRFDLNPLKPESEPNGAGVWRVHRNRAEEVSDEPLPYGMFKRGPFKVASPPTTTAKCDPRYSLPPSANENTLDPDYKSGVGIPRLIDLDGDGFLDLINVHKRQAGVYNDENILGTLDGMWCVYFGDGYQSFSEPYEWPVPTVYPYYDFGYATDTVTSTITRTLLRLSAADLRDMNGDGLPDLMIQAKDGQLKAYSNLGNQFSMQATNLGPFTALEVVQTDLPRLQVSQITDGVRGYKRRLLDLDGDGLLDMLFFPGNDNNIAAPQRPIALFGTGDHFLPAVEIRDEWVAAKRLFSAVNGNWHVESDFFDADGDGLADLATWDASNSLTIALRPGLPAAPDLLKTVDNGRGQRVTFSYAPSSDPTIVARTDEDYSLPHVMWVVESVKVRGGFGTPEMETRYSYTDPVYSGSLFDGQREPLSFAGMRQTHTSALRSDASIAQRTRREYVYAQPTNLPTSTLSFGPSGGLLLEQWTYRAEGGALRLHQHVSNTWEKKTLFTGQLSVTLMASSLVRTCAAGASEADCLAQTTNVLRTSQTWSPIRPSGAAGGVITDPYAQSPEMYVRSAAQRGRGAAPGEGDRRTANNYIVRYGQSGYDGADYRVLVTRSTLEESRLVSRSGQLQFELRGRTDTFYNPSTGLPERTEDWLDENTVATTRQTYDPKTGNLLSVTKPNQAAQGGSNATTSYTYDDFKLFVKTATNELGHVVTTIHDPGTGAMIERSGPNFVTLPSNTQVFERETWQVDGLGRALVHSISFDDPAAGYVLAPVDRFTYADRELPNRIREEHRRDASGPDTADAWVQSESLLDGLGRVLTETQRISDAQSAVTAYAYDNLGRLASIQTPDPRTDDGARVTYSYIYDGLGRPTLFTRPDGSGATISYDGLAQTFQEIAADGTGATKKEVRDVFGRLIELHEFNASAPVAITRYRYDVRDTLTHITDAENNVTTMAHDFAGRRVAIARGNRVWRYSYDLNGNVIARQSPQPIAAESSAAGAVALEPDVSFAYDALDRLIETRYGDLDVGLLGRKIFLPLVTKRSSATTGLQAEASLSPAAGGPLTPILTVIQYTYDQGRNGLGRLARVALPYAQIGYEYDARGLAIREQRAVRLQGAATLNATQAVQRAYNALGQLVETTWDDGQKWRMAYDARGLVSAVEWFDPGSGQYRQVANYPRSLAGQPRERQTAFDQARTYTYDVFGRVTNDVVRRVSANQPISTRAYSFYDAGDVKQVTGATNGVSADASYSYDAQHRLKTASGPNGYAGAFSYSATGNLLSATVSWSGSAEARDVRYEYGARDPQAVDRLVSAGTNTPYAHFAYDLSGNMTSRATPAGTTALAWDDRNQLRVADGPNGREVYFYDHNGTRMMAVSQAEGVKLWFAESETHYTPSGAQAKRYLHLGDGGGALARVEDKTKIELQYADALHNLMLATDTHGNPTASFLYGPFGEVVQSAGAADHRRQFNGKENDAVGGLRYYGYRYYDPLALRWNSADPLYRVLPDLGVRAPQRMNWYAFSMNNPVRFYDPDGRDGKEAESCQIDDPTCEEGTVDDGESCQDSDNGECTAEATDDQNVAECDPQYATCQEGETESSDEPKAAPATTTTASNVPGNVPKGPGKSGVLSWVGRKAREVLAAIMIGRDISLVQEDGVLLTRKQLMEKRTQKPRFPAQVNQSSGKVQGRFGFGRAIGIFNMFIGVSNDRATQQRADESGRTFGEQMREESKDAPMIMFGPFLFPNPNHPDFDIYGRYEG